MFKKTLLTFICTCAFMLSVQATANIPYKNLSNNSYITFNEDSGVWELTNKKNAIYILKRDVNAATGFSEILSKEGEFLFSTGCQYEFINKGSLIGYSNFDLKFYEFFMINGILKQRELSEDEIQTLFKDYKIVKLSDFSKSTNSIKINRKSGALKIILLNDTDKVFENYSFSTNNAKFETYDLTGFLNVTKDGMIQFSANGENSKIKPWYILLVR